MRLWTADRASGKTTAAIRWVERDPERRAIIVATAREAQNVGHLIRRNVADVDVAARIRVFHVGQLMAGPMHHRDLEIWVDDPARVLTAWLREAHGLVAEHGAVTPTGPLDLPAFMVDA